MAKQCLSFTLKMAPPTVTFQDKEIKVRRSKGGKPTRFVGSSAAWQAVQIEYLARIRQAVDFRKLPEPLKPPLRIIANFFFGRDLRPSHQTDSIHHLLKPDADNMGKGLVDVLKKAGIIEDDCGVQSRAEKYWSIAPRIEIDILQLDETDKPYRETRKE